jgi:hypothetical protein
LEPDGIVVSATGTEGSAADIEVSDLVSDVEAIVNKTVPMAYRGNFDLDISVAYCPYCVMYTCICKSSEEKDEHIATSHKDVERLKNCQLKRIEESNAARDKPNVIKHDPMSDDGFRVLKCDMCQMVFHSSIHLRAHQMYKHLIGGYSAEASYSTPNHILQNCTATSVSLCMYHPR